MRATDENKYVQRMLCRNMIHRLSCVENCPMKQRNQTRTRPSASTSAALAALESKPAPGQRFKSLARLSTAFSFDGDGMTATNVARIHNRCINVVRISPGPDPFIASAGLDCHLIFSKYLSGEIIRQIDTENSFVFDISISKTQYQCVVATASQDGVVRIYDARRNFDCIRSIKLRSEGVCPIIWAVQLFRDSSGISYFISGGANKTIHVVNWKSQQEAFILSGHKEGVRCLAVAEDGIIASGSNDHSVKLWNFEEQRFLQTFRGHTAEVNAVVFVPQTSYLFTACENNVFRQWNYHSGERMRLFKEYDGASILTLAVIPIRDNPLLLVGGTVSEKALAPLVPLQIWDINSGTLVASCTGTRYQISSASAWYDPDSKSCVAVAGGLDATIRMWRLSAAQLPGMELGEEPEQNESDIFEEKSTEG
jgi:WD40 repeat protein